MGQITSLIIRDWKRYTRVKMRFVLSIIMPIFFLSVFMMLLGNNLDIEIPTTTISLSYLLLLGFMCTTTAMSSLNGSMSLIEDSNSGVMREILVSPVKRWKIVIAKIIGNMLTVYIPVIVFFFLGMFMTGYVPDIQSILYLWVLVTVGSFAFSGFGIFLASWSSSATGMQSLISLVTFFLMFLSPAYFNTSTFPTWLQWVVAVNPLSYLVSSIKYYGSGLWNYSEITNEVLYEMGVLFKIGDWIVPPFVCVVVLVVFALIFFLFGIIKFNRMSLASVKSRGNQGGF